MVGMKPRTSLTILVLTSTFLALEARAQPVLQFPESLPVNLSWREWASTPEGTLQLTTQVTRDRGTPKLEPGAHLHFASTATDGQTLRETIVELPAAYLNRPGVASRLPHSHRRNFRRPSARVEIPLPAQAAQVAVSHCTSVH